MSKKISNGDGSFGKNIIFFLIFFGFFLGGGGFKVNKPKFDQMISVFFLISFSRNAMFVYFRAQEQFTAGH